MESKNAAVLRRPMGLGNGLRNWGMCEIKTNSDTILKSLLAALIKPFESLLMKKKKITT